ncbi:MAG: RNA 2',3'-cyclic phosphodiesterase [Patescibacteria group bacterium]|nr:RNA 2',3'-cyclic phosphodiesterase [Patescibacteria group bacterium]MDD5294396.1 RNA 2',3'-cyclic phosphodiesterase [Patescibacteria group bacterium]MDD5554829.1 RNA 2',3'-cyclic phosphodiesterase [Patescibacteria group bacterium]
MTGNDRKRLFIALNLPREIKEKLVGFIDDLSRQNRGVKWVNSEGLHLTLHFLGYLDEKKIEEVKSMMNGLAGKIGDMEFSLKRIDAFPNLTRPRIIFLEAKQTGDQSVFDLQELLGLELIKLKIDIDDRPWRSHITLGRVKTPNINLRLVPEPEILPLNFEISSFELMESELTPSGAKYKEVASFKL